MAFKIILNYFSYRRHHVKLLFVVYVDVISLLATSGAFRWWFSQVMMPHTRLCGWIKEMVSFYLSR